MDLKNKAKPCEFEHLSDGLIRDRIVCGIQNEGCRARLLREADLTLAKAIDTCRAQEMSSQQLKSLKSTEEHSVNAVKQVSKPRYRQNDSHKNQRSVHADRQALCKNCGRTHGKRNCPAFGKECHSCNKKNHFAKYCMSKQKKKIDAIQYDYNYDSEDELFIGTVSVDSIQQGEEWKESMSLNKQSVVFKLDTGAQANIISEKLFRKLSLPDNRTEKTNIKLVTYDGHKISPIGTRMLECTFKDRKYNLKFFIVPTDSQPILSADTCSEIGAIVRVRAVDKPLTKEEVISDYGEIFKGLGTLPKTHHIEVNPLIPSVVHPPRKIPAALRDQVRTELDRMESLGVIAKQDEPTDWVHSMVVVRKPGKLRVCIDPKDLNRAIKREHYHLETIDEIVERLPKASVFSRFDATHGFWQIQLDEDSSKLLTFNTPFGRYRYRRLPFGISSAPEVFSKAVREMFVDLPGVECIVDDILVRGENDEQHEIPRS
ncbi:unnamed protein product [Mytilus coruscus]|uniref:Reverse transcriptase domain-containing protein n=1 Tax=Mytilus coruscus TaxID=42192 RepID=A0A6J8C9P0_MYTCO|nr:unnamed protein product [Mytilus coruscus]